MTKLHIKYAYPLDSSRRRMFKEKNLIYPSAEEVTNKVKAWSEKWQELNKNDRIFNLLNKITKVILPRDLELFIFGAGLSAMSNPLIMPIIGKNGPLNDEQFTDTVIHEITHRYIGDPENNPGISDYWSCIRDEYSTETPLTQNHILVYAILDKVFTEIVGKDRVSNYINPSHPDYVRAFTIAKEKGSDSLIKQFHSFLK